MTSTASAHNPTPDRWKGLKDPTIKRPYAARRMSGLDALEYSAMLNPKNSNSYVIPQRRDSNPGSPGSPTFEDFQSPTKRTRIEELKGSGLAKRRCDEGNYINAAALGEQPEKKRVRFEETKKRRGGEVIRETEVTVKERTEQPEDTVKQTEETAEQLPKETEPEATSKQPEANERSEATTQQPEAAEYVANDITNMTFDSLVFKRLKELCQEQGISVPKGAKKKSEFVSLLAERFPAPRLIMTEQPLVSFTKEALETKCRDLGISDTGSKTKLVERLEALLSVSV